MKIVILFTMNGCGFCDQMKKLLKKNKIEYVDRDIHEYADEYEAFVKSTQNEYVPAFILLTSDESFEEHTNVKLLAPEDDYKDLEDAVKIIIDDI